MRDKAKIQKELKDNSLHISRLKEAGVDATFFEELQSKLETELKEGSTTDVKKKSRIRAKID